MAGSSTADAAQSRLRPAAERDLDFVLAVEAAPDTAPYLATATREYHLRLMADPSVDHFIVEAGGRPVGFVMVQTDAANRALNLRRLAVSEKGRGHGRAALRLTLRWAFEERRLHRVYLDVKPHNERARALYRSEGFHEEGLMRDALLFDGDFQSLVLMSILRPEYESARASIQPAP
jgi:diamine N-acetyltransferase